MASSDSYSDLNDLEKAVMTAMCEAVNNSKSAHIPEGAVSKKFPSNLRGDVKTVLKKSLKKKEYVVMHPTRGSNTYQLTEKGFKMCQIIRDEIRKK